MLDERQNYWRSYLGLDIDFDTAPYPAGYSEDFGEDRVTTKQRLFTQLASYAYAGVFEDFEGGWHLISRRKWASLPVVSVIDQDRFLILDRTVRSTVREDLVVQEAQWEQFDGFQNERTVTLEVKRPGPQPLGRQTWDASLGYFRKIPDAPFMFDDVVFLLEQGAPVELIFDISPLNVGNEIDAGELWGY